MDVVGVETREEDVDEEARNPTALRVIATSLAHRIQRVDCLLRLVSNGDRGEERASGGRQVLQHRLQPHGEIEA